MTWCCSSLLSSQPRCLSLEWGQTAWDADAPHNHLFLPSGCSRLAFLELCACHKPFPPQDTSLPHAPAIAQHWAMNSFQASSSFCGLFFNVIIIYRGNIHCSYIDNRLQSTGACSESGGTCPVPMALLWGRACAWCCSSGAPSCCSSLSLFCFLLKPGLTRRPFSMDFGGVSRCSAPLQISHWLCSISPLYLQSVAQIEPLGCSTPGSGHNPCILGSRLPARVKAVFQHGVPAPGQTGPCAVPRCSSRAGWLQVWSQAWRGHCLQALLVKRVHGTGCGGG